MSNTMSQLDAGQIIKNVHDATNDAIKVNLVSGVATVTIDFSQTDGATFTEGVDKVAMMGAIADEVAPTSVGEGQAGAPRMSLNRNLYTQIRDGSSERSAAVTAGNALKVDGSAVTQPISGTITEAGYTSSEFARIDYTSINVTTVAYTALLASTATAYQEFEIFDSSGQTLVIAFGAAASEVNKFLVFPGGNGRIKRNVPSGTRISIKAVSATANTGEISLNLYG